MDKIKIIREALQFITYNITLTPDSCQQAYDMQTTAKQALQALAELETSMVSERSVDIPIEQPPETKAQYDAVTQAMINGDLIILTHKQQETMLEQPTANEELIKEIDIILGYTSEEFENKVAQWRISPLLKQLKTLLSNEELIKEMIMETEYTHVATMPIPLYEKIKRHLSQVKQPTANEELIKEIEEWFAYVEETGNHPRHFDMSYLLRRCKTALLQVRPSWQPIESAPRDGTEILIWGTLYNMGVANNSWHIGRYNRGWWSDDRATISHATHWQPLPPAPTEK